MLLAAPDIGLERSDASSKLDRNRILYKFLEERGVEIGSVPLHRLLEPRHASYICMGGNVSC